MLLIEYEYYLNIIQILLILKMNMSKLFIMVFVCMCSPSYAPTDDVVCADINSMYNSTTNSTTDPTEAGCVDGKDSPTWVDRDGDYCYQYAQNPSWCLSAASWGVNGVDATTMCCETCGAALANSTMNTNFTNPVICDGYEECQGLTIDGSANNVTNNGTLLTNGTAPLEVYCLNTRACHVGFYRLQCISSHLVVYIHLTNHMSLFSPLIHFFV